MMGFLSGSSAQGLLLLLLCLTAWELRVCRGDSHVGCPDAEHAALLSFKVGLDDPDNRLSSWLGHSCCRWSGVACDNRTGAVTGIRLRDSSMSTNSARSWNLSGKLGPSLLQLKSLDQLDLRRSRYLNLSSARFAGAIPPQLGNLSSLQYLDVSSGFYHLAADNSA